MPSLRTDTSPVAPPRQRQRGAFARLLCAASGLALAILSARASWDARAQDLPLDLLTPALASPVPDAPPSEPDEPEPERVADASPPWSQPPDAPIALAVDAEATKSDESQSAGELAVPKLVGRNLAKARRTLRTLGLKAELRDNYGAAIDPGLLGEYRVRSQSLPAGAFVAKGTKIRLVARLFPRPSEGY